MTPRLTPYPAVSPGRVYDEFGSTGNQRQLPLPTTMPLLSPGSGSFGRLYLLSPQTLRGDKRQHRPVTLRELVYIGKETNRLEAVEAGLIHAWGEVQLVFHDPQVARPMLLKNCAASGNPVQNVAHVLLLFRVPTAGVPATRALSRNQDEPD